ncbi:DUF1989 domain-containing protein [Leeuwenhoekiella sp. W20_SRS_FM14]|uniref:DUF1989 domain-containing protein n=1 Tax=Leeuwenhoekiella sp. W20_SRS_FM14 TaxID=3240270 RepID=UPI003F995ED4
MLKTIPIQSGDSFTLKKGQFLKVIDVKGEQVSDLVVFNANDYNEKISAGKSMDFEESILLTTGNFIWSNLGNKLLKIIEDTNGRNDFLLAPCSQETFEIMYGIKEDHPSCFNNLTNALKIFDIPYYDIPTAFNVFMNVQFDQAGKISVLPPTSKAGDYVIFEAQIDLVGALTACSASDSNGGSFKPIQFEILDTI